MVFRLRKRDSWKESPEQARRDVSLCDHLCAVHRVPVSHERRLPGVGRAERHGMVWLPRYFSRYRSVPPYVRQTGNSTPIICSPFPGITEE